MNYHDILQSKRLFLQFLRINDCDFIFHLVNSPGWLEFIGNRKVYSQFEAKDYIQKILENPDCNYWVVHLKETALPIGIVTLIKRDYLSHPDIGFAFLPQFFNHGYALEATWAILEYSINHGYYANINAVTIGRNVKSIRLLNKLGLQFEEEIVKNNEMLQIFGATSEKILITSIIRHFFSAFTNKHKYQPDLELLNDLCIPQIVLINRKGPEVLIYDLALFMEPRQRILTDGTLTEFEEKEIHEETRIVNGIAYRYSEYEKQGIMSGQPFKIKGVKIFQLIKFGSTWKIVSVTWSDDDCGV